jgi:hypothetical protein
VKSRPFRIAICALLLASFVMACDQHPQTWVVFENSYPSSAGTAVVVYRAFWQALAFQQSLPPGASSDPQDAGVLAASANIAYAVLAPGWNPDAGSVPASLVFLQSRSGFEVQLNDTLYIPVDDTTFAGNCSAGSFLSQDQADFLTQRVFTQTLFPDAFPPFRYEAKTCTTTPIMDAGGP